MEALAASDPYVRFWNLPSKMVSWLHVIDLQRCQRRDYQYYNDENCGIPEIPKKKHKSRNTSCQVRNGIASMLLFLSFLSVFSVTCPMFFSDDLQGDNIWLQIAECVKKTLLAIGPKMQVPALSQALNHPG